MKPENKRMQEFLKKHGIEARVKYIRNGTIQGCWRLYNPKMLWTEELKDNLTSLGFVDFDNSPLSRHAGNGGVFSVFVRGHNEFLNVFYS